MLKFFLMGDISMVFDRGDIFTFLQDISEAFRVKTKFALSRYQYI
jgi:hypothetical protein